MDEIEDLYRHLARWLVDVALAPHRPVHHPGPCGSRLSCLRCGPAQGPYQTVELRADGELLFHCHGGRFNLLAPTAIRWIVP